MRVKIAKILIKWGMGTRQVVISDILNLFHKEQSEALQMLEGYKCGEHKKLKRKLGRKL